MGSAHDRAPDLTRTPTWTWPPLPIRPRLQTIAPTESRGPILPRQEPPKSSGAAPARSVHSPATPLPGRQPKLLDRLREALRARHYSRRTEQSYCQWVKRFIFFHNVRHPADMAEPEINSFLTHLALQEKVSAPTQTQALRALLFLYRYVLGRPLGDLGAIIRARKPHRVPVVLTRQEVKALLGHLDGDKWLMASLMSGTGLRLMECLVLRIHDVDLAQNQITVRDGKGFKDRITMLPEAVKGPLVTHLERVKRLHQRDLADGHGRANLPYALARKYPTAPAEWGWQFLSPKNIGGSTRRPAPRAAITPMSPSSSGRSRSRPARPGSSSMRPATPSATPSPPTFWRRGTTSGPFKNCSGIKTSRRP